MEELKIISELKVVQPDFIPLEAVSLYPDEAYIKVKGEQFADICLVLHKILPSPVEMFFAVDERQKAQKFILNCVFVSLKKSLWVTVSTDISENHPSFDSLAKNIYSANFFEREIYEMFGVLPVGNPDLRRLNLHDEVWPKGSFPLRKDFKAKQPGELDSYKFSRVEGEGVFEVPVGPVHAGIIGPGHFRFSVAGEPIVNLEIRLGFTHRGVEKLFEGRAITEAVKLAERVSGDSAFSHSWAFSMAAEKICGITAPKEATYLRGIFLELERIYNHANDIGGIALDVGFSFASAYASLIKEAILQLNEKLTGSRYLKNINQPGNLEANFTLEKKICLIATLDKVMRDFQELVQILYSSVSFMDRVDTAGVLRKKTARDLGIVGLAARASGIPTDLRKYFPGIYKEAKFKMITQESGDVLARLKVRIQEVEESSRLIREFVTKLDFSRPKVKLTPKSGTALGYIEGWRGPVLYWLKTDINGIIERCKIVDASFHNWQGLSFAALGNIIPDFPLCNKSFDLSYAGNDL
ncbi:MAG: NADH-quinone oxidoreductase subunit C [Candidatus Omnitrophica bacterium]|nr:NADH-quinone oxidoreductase subunit C [Candidatus Omnitrophota bacterium]MDD5653415.1 NADH-quinone oxidoreductase subunit C [Candidatus Omnitrophota bacterium]